jgi:hypothetical protein
MREVAAALAERGHRGVRLGSECRWSRPTFSSTRKAAALGSAVYASHRSTIPLALEISLISGDDRKPATVIYWIGRFAVITQRKPKSRPFPRCVVRC